MFSKIGQLTVIYLQLARPYNALLPIVAVVVGFAAAGGSDWLMCGLAALVMFLIHSAVTVWNDISDAEDDKNNGITRIGAAKKHGLYHSLITANAIAILTASLVALASGKLALVVLVAVYLMLGWMYNSRPLRLSKRPVASMFVLALAYGAVPFLFGALLGHVSWFVWVLIVAWTCNRVSLSLLKDYKDAKGDAVSNKKTFLLVYGARKTAFISISLLCIGLLLTTAASWVHLRVIEVTLAMIVVSVWLLFERLRLREHQNYRDLNKTFHNCLHYQLLFDGLVLGWLII